MTGFGMGLEGWLVMAGWAALVIAAVALLVREPRHAAPQDASAILRARFARGELTEAEYRHAAALLGGDPGGTLPPTLPTPTQAHAGQEARHD
jgi:uncharacterized membrane protein